MQHPNLYIIAGPNGAGKTTAVVEEHRRNNQPLIFSENGQVQYVDPFTVAI